jgi:hypothetical protein
MYFVTCWLLKNVLKYSNEVHLLRYLTPLTVDKLNLQLCICMVCLCKYHKLVTNLFSPSLLTTQIYKVWDMLSTGIRYLQQCSSIFKMTLNHLKIKDMVQLLEYQISLLNPTFLPMFCLYIREKGPWLGGPKSSVVDRTGPWSNPEPGAIFSIPPSGLERG